MRKMSRWVLSFSLAFLVLLILCTGYFFALINERIFLSLPSEILTPYNIELTLPEIMPESLSMKRHFSGGANFTFTVKCSSAEAEILRLKEPNALQTTNKDGIKIFTFTRESANTALISAVESSGHSSLWRANILLFSGAALLLSFVFYMIFHKEKKKEE